MPRRVFSIAAISVGVTMAVMDGTIMNIALPTLSREMSLSEADSIWIVNGYQLAIVMLLLSMSAIGEIFSYRRTYQAGLTIFTLASLICSFSPSFHWLVFGRFMQGVGASAMMAINITLLRLSYPKRWLGKGLGINATIVAIASVIGPSLAAMLLAMGNWRWIFLINLPLGLISFLLGYKSLPQNIVKQTDRRFPKRDAWMNAFFFGSLILALEGISHGFPHWVIALIAMVFIIDSWFYIRRQLRLRYPMLPVDLMRIPLFSISVLTSIASFAAQMLAMVSLPFLLQHKLGFNESETGLLFTAWPISIMVAAPLAGSLIGKVNAGILGGIGLASLSIGIYALAFIPMDTSYIDIIWRLILCGFGFGLFQSPNNNILITSAPPVRSGSASGMLATARLIGQTTGATMVALMFHLFADEATHMALLTGGSIALLACLLSLSRLKMNDKRNN